jgi:hypothetical protein
VARSVFISYSRSDRRVVELFAARLRAHGLDVWYDYEIVTGERFSQVIQQRIDACAVVIVMMSPASVASEWVDREITYAQQQFKSIMPVRIAPCRAPLLLANLDYSTPGPDGGPTRELVAELLRRVGQTTPTGTQSIPRRPAPSSTVYQAGRRPHRSWVPVAAVVILLVAAIGGVFWWLDPKPGGGTPPQARPTTPSAVSPSAVSPSPSPTTHAAIASKPALSVGDRRTITGIPASIYGESYRPALSPDGGTVAVPTDTASVILRSTTVDAPVHTPLTCAPSASDPAGLIAAVAFSTDGSTLVAANQLGVACVWHLPGYTPASTFSVHGGVTALALSSDGQTLAIVTNNGALQLWDTNARRQIGPDLVGDSQAAYGVAISADGQTLATTGLSGAVRLYSVATQTLRGQPLAGHTSATYGVAFSPDGAFVASTSFDNTVRIWDVAKRQQVGKPLSGHTKAAFDVAFSPDGSRLATASYDGTVRLWDPVTHLQVGGSLVSVSTEMLGISFSANGSMLAAGSATGTVYVWPISS